MNDKLRSKNAQLFDSQIDYVGKIAKKTGLSWNASLRLVVEEHRDRKGVS